MLKNSPVDSPQLSFFDITSQLNSSHPILKLAETINWSKFEESFAPLYSVLGRGSKPIRLMVGLLILKQLNNLSDEQVVENWLLSPYYQVFCGETSFQIEKPCHSTELVKFRQRIGSDGINLIFCESIALFGDKAMENTVLVDTTVHPSNITYPTDHKLSIKIINRLNKLAKKNGVKQRRTFVKEVKRLRLDCRMFRHVKRRKKATRALNRLRTIAGVLLRELQRKLPTPIADQEKANFEMYEKVLAQKRNDKDKIYSLHEPEAYCMAKGKENKPYEYGRKASVAVTNKNKIIVGVAHHEQNQHDSKTLPEVIDNVQCNTNGSVKTVAVDRGYRGSINKVSEEVIIPNAPLKRDCIAVRKRKKKLCQRRSAIEPIIGHLKQNYRLSKCYLKGEAGHEINLLMAAAAWNFRKWMVIFFVSNKFDYILTICVIFYSNSGRFSLVMNCKRH